MLQFFLNPWALLGLSGVGLAVLAHLISRRRFDVVQWGAMQFLNPARKTRRKLKLEELLLMLIRMAMIAVFALAVTRPWLPSGLLSGYRSMGSRSVVLIIDGSNSMSRGDGLNTLHQNAGRRAAEFLETLSPGDSVALIDARDQPRTVIASPLQDRRVVKQAIVELPQPAGAANIPAAVERAIAILARSSAGAREIVVMTDRQRAGWHPEKDSLWQRIDDLLAFPSVRPQVWMVDISAGLTPIQSNIAVGQLQLSRDLTVPDFPVRLSTTLQNSSETEILVPVQLLQDGQPLATYRQEVRVPPSGQASVEFDLTIGTTGTHLISVEADAVGETIRADNISHAAIHVASALPVLIVNGRPSAVPAERETFFAELALQASGSTTPWLAVYRVESADVSSEDIQRAAMIVLADVGSLPPGIPAVLAEYTAAGGGVLISLGPTTTPDSFQSLYCDSGLISGVKLVRQKEAAPDQAREVNVAQTSLQSGWLDRFRSDTARSFLKARYQQWWLTVVTSVSSQSPSEDLPLLPAGDEPPAFDVSAAAHQAKEIEASRPSILASLSTGDPLLIHTGYGRGSVLLLTSTLSRRWNTLPTTADYVPFLHEAIFQAAASRIPRNVAFGTPLVAPISATHRGQPVDAADTGFWCPGNEFKPGDLRPSSMSIDDARSKSAQSAESQPAGAAEPAAAVKGDSVAPLVQAVAAQRILTDTDIPGVYQLLASQPAAADRISAADLLDQFVVNYDHSEDDMTELTLDDRARLRANDRVHFLDSATDLTQEMYGHEARTELWAVLICLFPCFLLLELWVTRRLIQKGYSGETT